MELEIQIAIQTIKNCKAADFDEEHPEFIKRCGPKTRR